jgi:hypothetical protein
VIEGVGESPARGVVAGGLSLDGSVTLGCARAGLCVPAAGASVDRKVTGAWVRAALWVGGKSVRPASCLG